MSSKANLDKFRPKVKFADVFSFFTTHPGLTVFLVYATIAIAGFIYLVTFYAHFDLKVTVYLEITDILVAGIKDPMVMLMVAIAFSMVLVIWILVYIQAPFSAWLEKKFDKGFFKFIPYILGYKGPRSFWWTAFIVLTVYFFVFIGSHSKNKADRILKDKQELIIVDADATANSVDQYSLLGTSINYVFLYNHQKKNTLILPLESIRSLTPTKSTPVKSPVKSD